MPARLLQFLDRYAWRLPSYQHLEEFHRRLAAERDEIVRQKDTLERERNELAGHAGRLRRELADSLVRERAWEQERTELLRQRDALEIERDELLAHCRRFDRDVAHARDREDAAVRDVVSILSQRDALEAERDELKQHLESLRRERDRLRGLLWSEPGHYYSPLVNPGDARVRRAAARTDAVAGAPPPEIHFNETEMTALFNKLSVHYRRLPFPDRKAPGWRYYFENPAFTYGDAITLFGLLLEWKPKRVIEAGSGFSSCLLMDVNDRFLGGDMELTFIDPHPDTLHELLEKDDPYRRKILASPLQDVPLDRFTALERNDVLFLDTSHVLKTGSDVNDYLFRILPALKPGVIVHVHDVLYPFEYPSLWAVEENRSWNEAYALRAFLQYNSAFEVIYFNNYVYRKHEELTRSRMPRCLVNKGGSVWLRKVA